MTRPARLVACLLAVVAAAGTALLSPAASAADEGSSARTPLRVSVETLTPAVVPPSGRVTLTGHITNRSQETWTGLNAYLFTSSAPITGRADLADAAATSAEEFVGNRVTTEGLYDEVGDLGPGDTTSYRVSVPRTSLDVGDQPGVYWVGVHVLGAPEGGERDNVADGRGRTFIPMLPRSNAPARLALVVPVRAEVRRGAAGRLLGFRSWQRSLSADGRLDRLLNLSGRATRPITWVVDPAVLDAARSVAHENPEIDSGPDGAPRKTGSTSPSGSASPLDDATGGGANGGANGGPDGGPDGTPPAEPTSQAVAARAWLEEFRRQAPTHAVTTVPYGDLDVASVLGRRFDDLYRQARDLSAETMSSLGVERVVPVVDPVSGRLPAVALRRIDTGIPVLLGDEAFPDAQQTTLVRDGRAPVVLTDTGAGSGGPEPNARYAALAVRQRVLSEAALHALSGDRDQPLVLSTPPYWDPGSAWNESDFFAALDQPWVQMVDLPAVVSGVVSSVVSRAGRTASTVPSAEDTPVYSGADRRAEVPLANLVATRRLETTGDTYGRLLTANDAVEGALTRIGMLASSQNVRDDTDGALNQVNSTIGYVRAQMRAVRIEGPQFVMMSGEQGPIQVTLVNGLDQPVRVGIAARTGGSGLTISRHDPVTLGAGKRTVIRLAASSNDIGVHAVTLVATDTRGNPIGSLTRFNVRTSRVSTVIWVIMAVGGVLLFLTIGVRLFRRIRRRKSTHGPRLARRDTAGVPAQELDA